MITNTEQGMFAEERKTKIIELLYETKKVTVQELCDKFDVSQATIRNDLNELHKKGALMRTHGGAVSAQSVNYEMNVVERKVHFQHEKEAIAKRAVEFIREGDCVGLDAGSTTYEMAKLLSGFEKLTIVTYDMVIASYLDNNTNHTIILAGGEIRKHFHYLTGEAALNLLRELYLDVIFLAANGVDPDKGLTTPNIDTAEIKKCLIGNARHKVLLADHSKIGNISFAKYAEVSEVDTFITDSGASAHSLRALSEKNIEVISVRCKA